MGLVLRLVETAIDGSSRSVDVLEIECPGDLGDLADLGLTLANGKQLLTQVQQAVVAAQCRNHAARRLHLIPRAPRSRSTHARPVPTRR